MGSTVLPVTCAFRSPYPVRDKQPYVDRGHETARNWFRSGRPLATRSPSALRRGISAHTIGMLGKRVLAAALGLMAGSLIAQRPQGSATNQAAVSVPFVGCPSDGQMGPVEAPSGKGPLLTISGELAQSLAYYRSEGFGVLGPRGWHCFGRYGSGGATLYVSPQPIDFNDTLAETATVFKGPIIVFAESDGGTSGRFHVAGVIARVFPAHRAFVNGLIKNDPGQGYPSGPFPKDRLTYKSKERVEFFTPAQTDGLGTDLGLQKNADPIKGVAILSGPTPNLLMLFVRLPPGQDMVTSAIIRQVELEAAN
jgi:hypothetical protein